MHVCGCSAPNLRRFLLRALFFLAAVLPTSGDCPKSCACNVPTEVHCTFRYLTAIPDHIQPAVERINLGYNSITVLRENDLSGLGNLELLMLHSNTIHSIDDRAFQDLKSLQVLKVSFNKVKEIRKETFKGLDSLLRLHIDHNNIEFISPDAFYGLTRLQLVHLEGNHLQQLHPDTFITLRHSQVFKISSMRNIHLSDNLLTTLPEGIFSGCSELENLFLHGNPWTCDCRTKWFSVWVQRNTGVLKCKRDRRYPRGQLCPVCESPAPYHNRPLSLLTDDAFTCTKPWIQPHLKKKNISLDEGDYTPVSPKDFIAPLGSIQLKLTDQLHSDASLSCTVQRPSALENLTQTLEEGEGNNATMLTASISTYLVCNIDHEHIQQLWQMLATYSDSPLRLERGLMLTRSPEMVYRYSQMKKTNEGEEGIYTNIEAEIKASPAWLMQGEVSFQLDRTTTTFSTLHIKYESVVNLRVENTSPKRDRYSWTMIKQDNKTQTEYTVITGGVVQLSCQIQGEPKPLLEWILPDGSKVRAPFSSDDRRIIITAEGKLTLRGADASDTGLYRCITTNYLDADVLVFRVTVLSPDVEESDVNGVQLSQPLGENLFFDCSSSGSPEASLQWILPDHSVVGSSHGNRKVYDNGTLLVNGLTARDSGFYRCLVSNHLGFDLLVSQVTVTGETSERVTVLDSEGSGLEMEDKVYLSLTENTDTLNEIPSSSPSDGTSQESRTITSDRPYPRLRSQVRVGAGGRLGKKRKGPVSNRRIWSNRVFDKSSRKVDPQKFAEFMKKAQDGLRIKAGAEEEGIQYYHLNTIISGDGEIGSETQLQFSGAQPAESETSTGTSLSFTTDPHVTPMMDGPGPLELIVHTSTDPESQTTFTAVSTTERHQDEITFHTTQTIKSPRLPPGSTIISRQQIQIIPNKNSRGGGRRRTFHGRRRVIKPNRITDIQSFINKVKQPSVKKEGKSTVPYRIELTTACDWDEDKKKTETTDLQMVTPTAPSDSSLHRTERPSSAASTTNYYITSNSPFTHTESKKEDRAPVVISAYQTSKEETDLNEEFDWSTSSSLSAFTTTKAPLIPSTALTPTTSFMPITTKKWPYTTARTKVQRTPIQSNTGHATLRPPVRKIRPTVLSSGASDIADKELNAMTILTDEQGPNNNKGPHYDISSAHDRVTGNEATRTNTAGFEPTTNIMTNKPKIVGGNAASFTVLSNSDAFLPCEAVGNPEPAITWKRFSSTTGTGKMGKFEVLSNGTLFIQNANIKDRGQYICLAENEYGSDKLFVTLSVVAYPSRILEPKIREIKSHAGNTVEMKCRAEGRPLPMLSWILANRTQVKGQNTEKGRVSVSADGTLVIEEVSVYDRGHYKCIASNPAGADTATVRLQVVASPPGIVEEKRQQVKVGVNQHLWLPCTGQGSPQPAIHWVLNDGSMVQSNRPASRISVYVNGTLHIKDVTPKDSGKFECIATSSTGSEKRVVTLTVERQESAPQIVETSQRVTVLFFEDQLRLNCSATGDPKPQILWRLPSKAIVDQEHRMGSRIQVLDNGTLIVTAMSDKDAGDYLCVARNKIGDDLHLMKVSVSMKAAKIEPKHYGKKKVPFGNDFKVDCKASGAPKPEISWGLPDGTVVNSALQSDASSGQGRARRYTLFDNGTLYLNQVSMSEEGDYTCYAENQVGKDEMHLHITVVTAAPRIRSTGQTYARVKPGGNIRFDCEALGEPKPKILWMLPTNDVIAASNERYLMHVNGSLDIRDVKLIDVGEYICMARNPAGENRKVYKLDMEGNPPVINGYRQNRTVIKDVAAKYSRKLIDCNADGDPMPSITWIMPDNIFIKAPYFGSRINVHHNGTLEIRNVRPTDTAEFICMARNDGGEAVMVVQLEVSSILRRPIFKNPFNERVVSRIGKTTVLNCSAGGYPMPEISWTLPNGTRLTSGHPLVKNGTLVIYNPSKENAGKYRCGAKNFMGYIEKLIILDVGQPHILTRPRGVIRSAAGEPLLIHCLSDGNPRPHIYWTIPGGHILTQPQVSGRFQVLQNGTLIVQDTTIHDQGNYICRARSSAGEAVLTVPVIIIAYPPRITTGPPPIVRGVTGIPIQLNCAAIGIPKPEIIWELPDHSVLSAADQGRPMGSELLHPQGTLIIQRPKASDSGTYKCQAKNLLGTDSKVTYVRIL
ncbi:immunoglobulin superfamily member 10 [Notothenia coriiceps]|uniref:immunoglobulin superfamily member 10 n=1 Tax=Notothenia coriiceps TaxID=8208 RepID=UPI00054DBDB3|nr:PREDICTED: immunoglobulin superfamily member 10 [Notothenia coriiceps]